MINSNKTSAGDLELSAEQIRCFDVAQKLMQEFTKKYNVIVMPVNMATTQTVTGLIANIGHTRYEECIKAGRQ